MANTWLLWEPEGNYWAAWWMTGKKLFEEVGQEGVKKVGELERVRLHRTSLPSFFFEILYFII